MYLPTRVVALRLGLLRYPGAGTGARGFALGAGPGTWAWRRQGELPRGLSDCAQVRRRPGGRAVALHSDI